MIGSRIVVDAALGRAVDRLLAERRPEGAWVGELSTSALATATALVALASARRAEVADDDVAALVDGAATWLAGHQNDDGGWGDTPDSPANISTTTLCWAALGAATGSQARHGATVRRAEAWLRHRVGSLEPQHVAAAIVQRYGEDRTFSAPILTHCALSGRFGAGRDAWTSVPAIPFELAACPPSWFARLGLPMVSYALPALISIGQVVHHHRPTRNPLARLVRAAARRRTLAVLDSIQPRTGGFLEAVPLTSFVLMSLIASGQADHPVVGRGIEFLRSRVRPDGGWPIDTNLATWVTTLSVDALGSDGCLAERLGEDERARLLSWLLEQQHRRRHPYTRAEAGGWAWTPLDGGVPDADDTAGALLALARLAGPEPAPRVVDAAADGVGWLLRLQNRDGGIPTFCRGWGKLPFDRGGADLTAHALRAWSAWRHAMTSQLRRRIDSAIERGVGFLLDCQRNDGAWIPLWFGNQSQAAQQSPLYGTSRVLRAITVGPIPAELEAGWRQATRRARDWLLSAQHASGGFGGDVGLEPTVEETALAVEALTEVLAATDDPARRAALAGAVEGGCGWLLENTAGGDRFPASPIGLYFAKLWYSERLYPMIFTVAALTRARHVLGSDVAESRRPARV